VHVADVRYSGGPALGAVTCAGQAHALLTDFPYQNRQECSFTIDRLIAEAEIFFAHVEPDQLKDLTGSDNFVFTGNLQKMLGLAKAAAKKAEPAA